MILPEKKLDTKIFFIWQVLIDLRSISGYFLTGPYVWHFLIEKLEVRFPHLLIFRNTFIRYFLWRILHEENLDTKIFLIWQVLIDLGQ